MASDHEYSCVEYLHQFLVGFHASRPTQHSCLNIAGETELIPWCHAQNSTYALKMFQLQSLASQRLLVLLVVCTFHAVFVRFSVPVWMSISASDAFGKFCAIFLPISAFVAVGLDHSVANM